MILHAAILGSIISNRRYRLYLMGPDLFEKLDTEDTSWIPTFLQSFNLASHPALLVPLYRYCVGRTREAYR